MRIVYAKSSLTFFILMLTVTINIGCSLSVLEQSQKTVAVEKPQESVFTVVDTTDLENPKLASTIHLPFHVNPNNNVDIIGKHAYVTTDRHLHVIDVSTHQSPIYLSSITFPDEIGKARVFEDHVFVTSRQKLFRVDVSNPSQPVIQSSTYLPQRNPIIDLDVRNFNLYVMGANDTLYIYSIDPEKIQLIRTAKLSEHWRFISPKDVSLMVEQISYTNQNRSGVPKGLSEPLISQRGFLQIRTSRKNRVRSSSEFLVEDIGTPDLLVYDAARIPRGDTSYFYTSTVDNHDMETDCRNYLLFSQMQMPVFYGTPKRTYTVEKSGKMQQITSESTTKEIDVRAKRFMGDLTDFQISGDILYAANAYGFLSIKLLVRIEENINGDRNRILSVTPLQECYPISIAVGEDAVCVLATPSD